MSPILLNHLIGFSLLVFLLAPLALYIYLKNPRSHLNFSFAFYLGSISWWAFFTIFMITSPTKELGLLWDKLCLSGVMFIPSAFFHFSTSFLDKDKKLQKAVFFNYAFSLLFLAILWSTSLFVKDVVPKFGMNYFTVPGPVYLLFIFFFLVNSYGPITLMGLTLRKTLPSIFRTQLIYFFWFSLIAFTGGTCNYLLVYDINIGGVAETTLRVGGARSGPGCGHSIRA